MTQNQIAYWSLQETKRSNQIREGETFRHNVATESETSRHNIAGENELHRHNVVDERERHRMNSSTIELQSAQTQTEGFKQAELTTRSAKNIAETAEKTRKTILGG